jgi:hypothetical protein
MIAIALVVSFSTALLQAVQIILHNTSDISTFNETEFIIETITLIILECIIFNDDVPIMSRPWLDILRFKSHQIAILTINVEQISSWSYSSQTYNVYLPTQSVSTEVSELFSDP